jgi:DNA mismatch repair protein MutL
MSKIRILPEDISNRIAAGEVIERPASVVKELVENSIDAEATSIKIIIEKAGRKLISITDNGTGMDEDDTLMCFEPHATSKITSLEDIDCIETMGFRGEAIPSIASISRFRLRTKKRDDIEGHEVIVEGGKFISSLPVGCAPGTEMSVKDLFFNTPARRKFLRTDNTEEKHITDTVCQLALANSSISFELIIDGEKSISTPGDSSLLPRIQTFFGKTMAKSLLPIEYEKAGIRVSGYIARHGFTKKSRKEQRAFLNNRPIESLSIYRGILNGYESLVMKGCYPPVILFLSMDPGRVDVNVHPAKREVRFREMHLVSTVITEAIHQTLRSAAAPTVSISSELPLNAILNGASVNYQPHHIEQCSFQGFDSKSAIPEILPEEYSTPPVTPDSNLRNSQDNENRHPQPSESLTPPSEPATSPPSSQESEYQTNLDFEILAFLDETYILAASENGLIIIDQHAAHERVLFEKLMTCAGPNAQSQKLLIPVTQDLSRSEVQFLNKNADSFLALGFEVESFGNNTVIIRAIPPALSVDDASNLFSELLNSIIEEEKLSGKVDKSAIAQAACKKAVKAHDKLTMDEARALLQQMSECSLPYSCPHGRPTIINISYKELEKRFGRK